MTVASRIRLTYIVTDWLTVAVAFFLFNYIRFVYLQAYLKPELQIFSWFITSPTLLAELILFPTMAVGLSWLSGFYAEPMFMSRLKAIGNSALIALIATLVFFFLAMLNDTLPRRRWNYELLAILFGLVWVAMSVGRLIISTYTARLIQKRLWTVPTLILGATSAARSFARRLDSLPKPMGFEICGFVDLGDGQRAPGRRPVWPLDALSEVIREKKIKSLIIVSDDPDILDTPGLLGTLMALDLPVRVRPEIGRRGVAGIPRFTNVSGEALVDISTPHLSAGMLNVKRVSDLLFASLALVVLSPVLAAVALAVKLDSPGPVFYRQRRLGYHRRPFDIIKFRSMRTDAEAAGPALSSGPGDSRITPVGRFIRKYRLDELPNFWNVVRGDMSIVGPRPEREYFVSRLIEREPYYALLHSVRPGITSWGMVKFGYATNVDEMIERMKYDLLYLENMSIGIDIKILFYTVRTVVTGRGI